MVWTKADVRQKGQKNATQGKAVAEAAHLLALRAVHAVPLMLRGLLERPGRAAPQHQQAHLTTHTAEVAELQGLLNPLYTSTALLSWPLLPVHLLSANCCPACWSGGTGCASPNSRTVTSNRRVGPLNTLNSYFTTMFIFPSAKHLVKVVPTPSPSPSGPTTPKAPKNFPCYFPRSTTSTISTLGPTLD